MIRVGVTVDEAARTLERESIVRTLRRRADKREESIVTAEHMQEVRWLRRIASMIEDGAEGLES